MATRRIVVEGTVQGVGFRYYVARQAERLGVAGEVWNRRDGKVELVAHHLDGARVAALEEALWLGPGRVTGVTGMDSLDRAEGGFSIGPTR